MDAFLRFQTQIRCGDTGRPGGLFVAAGRVKYRRALPTTTRELLRERLTWFNRNLIVPSLGEHDWRALFWFRSNAGEM
ncbi:MAG: hypothetical protein AAF961_10490, partial [Planctomycetota bacterium]